MDDEISRWRAEFPILSRVNYQNSCSLGALSHRAVDRVRQFQEEWHTYGASAWYETWMGRLAELRGRVERMLGADPGEVALMPSTSAALSSFASAVDHAHRTRVVVAELDFPTMAYVWMARPELEIVRVPSDDGVSIDPARWAEAIDERTAVVATSHVFFATGAIQDPRAIARIAHDRGALLVIDGYHGAGQVPVDVKALDCDVYTCGPLKWLLGGPGLSYMYVRRDLAASLRPTVAGWFGAEDQFAFDIRSFEPKPDTRRFEMGTPALPTVHSALGGQEIIDEVGVPRIREINRAHTARLVEQLETAGLPLRIARSPEDRSAIVMVGAEDPQALVRGLAAERIVVDWRPGYVRVSPHFYNTADEVDAAAEAIVRRVGR